VTFRREDAHVFTEQPRVSAEIRIRRDVSGLNVGISGGLKTLHGDGATTGHQHYDGDEQAGPFA
jgi:hypothetical protein